MSTQQTEDEWQAVEDNLKALSIKEQAQSKQTTPADKLGDDNGQVESIDTALMNALLNPRERMVLFHIEDAILNFMKSNDRQMDLPQCNSFRRLLYYRLGQRFGLCHTTTDQITETGERTIVLYKTATSSFPTVLLIDLAAQYPLDPTALDGGNYNNNNTTNNYNNSGQQSPTLAANQVYSLQNPANATATNRKVLVMKRKPARTDTSSIKSNISSKNAQSVEDKEKAYHEARARIFGDTGTPEGSTGGNSPCPYDDGESNSNSGLCTPQSEVYDTKNVTAGGNNGSGSGTSSVVDNNSTTATRGSTPINTSATLSNQSSSTSLSALGGEKSTSTSTKETNTTGIAEKRTTPDPTASRTPPLTNDNSYNNNANNNYNNRRNNNNYNNNNSRAQVRNIDAERSDPDFVRRSNVNRNTTGHGNKANGGNYFNNNNNNSGNGYNNNNYNQSCQQADQRYNMNNMNNNANMAYSMDPQALYLQQQQQLQMQMQMQYNAMQQQQQQGLPPANTPEAVQMQLQMQMQYQQMQLQMQMLAQQQQQQQMMMGGNPYYPNNNNNLPPPQGYNIHNGQSSPVPAPAYGPGYGVSYNNNSNNNNHLNGASQYNRGNHINNKQYKNDFPPLG